MYLYIWSNRAIRSRFRINRRANRAQASSHFLLFFLAYSLFNPLVGAPAFIPDNSMARHYQAKQQRSRFETLLERHGRLSVRRQSKRIGEAPRRMRPGLRIGLAGQELRIIGRWGCKADGLGRIRRSIRRLYEDCDFERWRVKRVTIVQNVRVTKRVTSEILTTNFSNEINPNNTLIWNQNVRDPLNIFYKDVF